MTIKEKVIKRIENYNAYIEMQEKENLHVNLYTKLEMEYLKDVLKALEVLDILKRAATKDKLFKLYDDDWNDEHILALTDYDYYHCSELTEEEYNKVKEWLEKCY